MSRAFAEVDRFLGKVTDVLGGVVGGFLENPLPTIASVALSTATGLPLWVTNSATTAIRGGSMEDFAINLATGYLGAELGSALGDVAIGEVPLEIAPEMAQTASQEMFRTVITNASPAALNAALKGESFTKVLESAVMGSVSGMVTKSIQTELGLDSTKLDQRLVNDSIGAATKAILGGQDVSTAIGSAIANTTLGTALGTASSGLKTAMKDLQAKTSDYDTYFGQYENLQTALAADENWLTNKYADLQNLTNTFEAKREDLLGAQENVQLAQAAMGVRPYGGVDLGVGNPHIVKLAEKLGWSQVVTDDYGGVGYAIPTGRMNYSPKYNEDGYIYAYDSWPETRVIETPDQVIAAVNPYISKLQNEAPQLDALGRQLAQETEAYNGVKTRYEGTANQLASIGSTLQTLRNDITGLLSQRDNFVTEINDLVDQSFAKGIDVAQGIAGDISNEAVKIIADSQKQVDQLPADIKEQKQISDDIFNELKQQFADADPREIRSIADTAAAETVRSDATDGSGTISIDVAGTSGFSSEGERQELIKQLGIERFYNTLSDSLGMGLKSNILGLGAVVDQLRQEGISDDVIEETLLNAQRTNPNFSSFLQSRAPKALGEAEGAGETAGTGEGTRPTTSDYDLTVEEKKPVGSVIAAGTTPTEQAQQRTLLGPGAVGGGEGGFRLISVDPNTGTKVYDTGNPDFSVLVLKDNQVKLMSNQTFQLFEPDPTESKDITDRVVEADTKEAAKTEELPELVLPPAKPEKEVTPSVGPPKSVEEVKPTPEPVAPQKPVEEVKPTAPQGPVAEVVTPPVQPAPVEPTPVQPAPAEPTPAAPTPVQPTPVQPTPVQPAPVEPTPVQPAPAGVSQQEMQDAINKAVGDAKAEGKAGDAALQAGIDKVASDLGITKDIVLESVGKSEAQLRQEMQAGQAQTAGQIAETEKTLRTEIGKLGSDFQSKFDAMSDAQKAEVDARAKQGQDLQTAINDVGRAATEKIAGVETSISNLDKKLSDAISDARQQGLEGDAALQSAINKVSEESGRGKEEILGQLGRTEAQLRSDFGSQLEAAKQTISTGFSDLDKRISDLVATGKSYQDATTQALTELGGQFESYKSAQEKAAEDAKKAAEEAAKEEEEKTKSKNLFNLGLSLLGGAGMAGASPLTSLISGSGTTSAAPPPYPQEIRGARTGESSGTQFESPLAAFQRLVDPRLAPAPTQEPKREEEMGYFSYGQDTNVEDVLGLNEESQVEAASGGSIVPMMAKGGLSMVHYAGKPRIDFRQGSYVQGPGDGQSDDIPAMLADGEYVFDAEIVSALGNGSNKAGAQLLDKMREHIRAHKRSGSLKKIPPPAKSPLEYLAMAKKGK